MEPGFLRHIAACNNARLPGDRLPLRVGGQAVGWVTPAVAAIVGLDLPPAALAPTVDRLVAAGLCRLRHELFDVRAELGGPALATVDRGALPVLGILAHGVHLNGLVRRDDGLHLWVGRRAADKKLDPNKLDHMVAGGVPAGLSPEATLAKEAGEEAGLDPALSAQAVHRGVIGYSMDRPEGLRRDSLHCYDIDLPADFIPQPVDGEVAAFELWPISRVVETVRCTDEFKFNVNLVLIDLFLRLGLVRDAPLAAALHRRGAD